MRNKVLSLSFAIVFVGGLLLSQPHKPLISTPPPQTSPPIWIKDMPTKVVLGYGGPNGDAKVASEILKVAYRRLGIEVVFEAIPQARSLIMSNEGKIDGEVTRLAGLEAQYPNLMMVPVVLIEQKGMAFTRKDKTFPLNGWDSLRPYSIVTLNGAKWSTDGTMGMDRVDIVTQPEQMFKMLEMGRVDVALGPRLTGMVQIMQLGFTDILPIEPPLVINKLYHYLNIKYKTHLLPQLSAVLQQMESSGQSSEIREQTIAAMLKQ
jgi:polar amino acid transport system substrate-binding protein